MFLSFPPGNEMFQFPGFAPAFKAGAGIASGGLPHSEIRAYYGYLPLDAAYRSLSRPSSLPRAKASFMCPSLLSVSFFYVPPTTLRIAGGDARALFSYRDEIYLRFRLQHVNLRSPRQASHRNSSHGSALGVMPR